ncbi:MAG TPA: 4Fe-4S dicluster domain-containing protein [Fervidicoccus fontis]|uniref:4Fe-4S dicluster domain-containing protein n=1 Tax=Fervidicoccus fontis TaxID=683846 RepID=A0A7C2ULL3_9CREN|nr:MAG: electron transporter [Fervidicoccus sp.]HEU97969.1 4Fe-4S dicluster domain-containing protein [Fervidicoccus fontis]
MGLHVGVDPTRCSGCRYCELWCSYRHEGFFSPYFSRIKVVKDEVLKIDFPLTCQQCEDAPCAKVCPTAAIYIDEDAGIVKLNEELCIGCGSCVSACPYGYLSLNPNSLKPLICDLCGGSPECIKRCPTGALFLTSEVMSRDVEIDDPLGRDHAKAVIESKKFRKVWVARNE